MAGHTTHHRKRDAMTIILTATEIVRKHCPDIFPEDLAELLAYSPDHPDAIAHELWSFGASAKHDGCRYADGDCDADYENNCTECSKYLLSEAERIICAAEATS